MIVESTQRIDVKPALSAAWIAYALNAYGISLCFGLPRGSSVNAINVAPSPYLEKLEDQRSNFSANGFPRSLSSKGLPVAARFPNATVVIALTVISTFLELCLRCRVMYFWD
jgi:hypothetical protein